MAVSQLIFRADRRNRSGVTAVEIRSQVDEITDGDIPIVIEITFLPGLVGAIEVACQIDEVGDRHLTIQVQIADPGGADLDVIVNLRQTDLCARVQARIHNAVECVGRAGGVGVSNG